MTARDTVIKTDVHTYPETYEHYKVMLEQQAEISFKAGYDKGLREGLSDGVESGIREVVDDIQETMDRARVGYTISAVERCLERWHAKLKEWGI